MSRAGKKVLWSMAFLAGVNMGITAGLMPKVSAADTKVVMDTVKKKDKVDDTIEVIDGKFEKIKEINKKKKKNMPMALSSAKKEVTDFIKALETYLADFDVTLKGNTVKEKVGSLNEYLGVETDYPTFVSPETIQLLEDKMILLNATLQDDMIADMAADLIAKTEPKTPFTKPTVEEPKPSEVVPTPIVGEKINPKVENLVNNLDKYIALCDEYNIDPKRKKSLEAYKEKALEANKPLSKKDADTLQILLISIDKQVEEKKTEETVEAEKISTAAIELTDKEKIEYYKYLAGFLKNKSVFAKPVYKGKNKVLPKNFPALSESKKENKQDRKLFVSALKKIGKGQMLSAEEESIFIAVALFKMGEAGGILGGVYKADYEAALNQAIDTQNPEYMKDAALILGNEAANVIAHTASYVNQQVKKMNGYRSKKQKLSVPKQYNLNTMKGVMKAFQWMYEKENETYAMIASNNVKKADLSTEANETVSGISKLRPLRLEVANAMNASVEMLPKDYVVKSKAEKNEHMQSDDYKDAVSLLEKSIELVEEASPGLESLEVAKEFLGAVKDVDNAYAKDPKKILAAANYLLLQQEYSLWTSMSGELGATKAQKKKAATYVEWANKVYERSFSVTAPVYSTPMLASNFMASAVMTLSPPLLPFYELDMMAKNKGVAPGDWMTAIKGSIGAQKAGAGLFVPLIQNPKYMSGEVGGSNVHPAWNRVELTTPGFGTLLTDPEVYSSNYGSTIGILEAQEGKLSPEKWETYNTKITSAAGSYGEKFVDVIKPAIKVKGSIVNDKDTELSELLKSYGVGLAPLEGIDHGAVVVTTQMLDVFGERGNETTEYGKVTAKEGETLKSVEFANLYYGAAMLIETEAKYDKLNYKVAKAKSEQLLDYLNKNLTEEAKENPDVKKSIGALMTVYSNADYAYALATLKNAGELGLSTIYVFDNSEAEDRFYWAKEVQASVNPLQNADVRESQLIALLDIAIEDAKALKSLMASGAIEFYLPKEVEEQVIAETPKPPEVDLFEVMPELIAIKSAVPDLTVTKVMSDTWSGVADPTELAENAVYIYGNLETAEAVLDAMANAMAVAASRTSTKSDVKESAQALYDALPATIGVADADALADYQNFRGKVQEAAETGSKNDLEWAVENIANDPNFGCNMNEAVHYFKYDAERNSLFYAPIGGQAEFWFELDKETLKQLQEGGEAPSKILGAFVKLTGMYMKYPGEFTEVDATGKVIEGGEKYKGTTEQAGAELGAGFMWSAFKKAQFTFRVQTSVKQEKVTGTVMGEKVDEAATYFSIDMVDLTLTLPNGTIFKGAGVGLLRPVAGKVKGGEPTTPHYGLNPVVHATFGWSKNGKHSGGIYFQPGIVFFGEGVEGFKPENILLFGAIHGNVLFKINSDHALGLKLNQNVTSQGLDEQIGVETRGGVEYYFKINKDAVGAITAEGYYDWTTEQWGILGGVKFLFGKKK